MATPRTTVANAIRSENITYIVLDYPDFPENIPTNKVHVSVFRTDVKTVEKTPNVLEHPLIIQVLVPVTTGAAAENAADDALDNILLSLQRIEGLSWSTAERSNFESAYIGYKITASVSSSNVYRTQVLEGI